ncbi:uncharacterized protein LOC123502772 [Portunus trituberculatus]|uniref:C2H2-type domain-containing protein n=1 Tax=Portunus trituberculatus TaxID=210409 RepID=A0A5B7CSD1_PORTR|nr:uncharacterized protein LOC123502772 [Portunus trituberculatus]MPC12677.1 hypothetical protein [Portunus trituberculatus]
MAPVEDASTCYICNDKRRTADTDAAVTPTRSPADSETLKDTLIRALSHGHVEDLMSESEKESRISSGVCVVSLNSGCDGGLEAVSDRVVDDHVVICRRCTGLLKDFEHHERTAGKIAQDIRRFLMRQMEAPEEDVSGVILAANHRAQSSVKKTVGRTHSERQGIMAALRALRKSGMTDSKRRGRKRKKDLASEGMKIEEEEKKEEDEGNVVKNTEMKEETNGEERQQEATSARQSQRIQRRREDGLVMRWGDAMYENEDEDKSGEDTFSDCSSDALFKDQPYVRRGRGRKVTRVVRSMSPGRAEYEMGIRLQCPFCLRYYIPMSSRMHGCTSYKNQLRCHTCNVFFTTYIRLERHLEVIHLKQKKFACPTEGCNFTCIAEATLIIHKHFHVIESFSGGNSKEAQSAQQKETEQKTVNNEEVIVLDDEHDAPKIADRVSFLLDEKSFLSDGHHLHITTHKVPKDAEDDCKILHFQGNEKNDNPSCLSDRWETSTLSLDKGECETLRKSNLVLECPICDITLASTKSYQEHVQEVHHIQVVTKIIDEDGTVKESQSSEPLTRTVKKYYRVKKNFIVAPKGLD